MKVTTSLVGLAGLIGQVALIGATPLPQKAGKADATTVSLAQGTVKGSTDSYGNSVFLGIPFAATTGGDNRYVLCVMYLHCH
jgi:hypothetical protein